MADRGRRARPAWATTAPVGERPSRGTADPRARWALVLGILSFVLLPVIGGVAAIVTGAKAKRAIDSSGGAKAGRRSAVAGEALGIVNVVVYPVVLLILALMLSAAAGQHVTYTKLKAGDCYNSVGGSLFGSLVEFGSSVEKADCAKPHKTQVTGSFRATDPGHFPGADGFRAQTIPKCSALALRFLGRYSPTGLRIVWLVPDQSLWAKGNRTVVCGVQDADGAKRTGSVRG